MKRTVTVVAQQRVDITIALAEGTGTYSETVDVRATIPTRREPAVAAEQTLGGVELQQLRGLITNDPLRAVQMLPSVAASDDLRSEFAIRGAGLAQMNFTFEGVATPFLLHTVQQVHDSGCRSRSRAGVRASSAAPMRSGAGNLRDGDNQAAIAVATWRYLRSSRFVATQRVAATDNAFNKPRRRRARCG
ncbi:MAG: hypothetical protein DMF98_08725 [Acidobacteria bacterium]|nr:MAG: hypothetical protein DMF98_08725 [Acidobacteriota bacterium]